ncbi:MAG: hypothetical protein KDJ99_13825, partial [Candidatus Competibacteraceae bacterium]|nr:hypothetical protein [Candidatus Competibacteraceae bacterium]
VKVKVMSVEIERKRIALSMRLQDDSREHQAQAPARKPTAKPQRSTPRPNAKANPAGALADAFQRAKQR